MNIGCYEIRLWSTDKAKLLKVGADSLQALAACPVVGSTYGTKSLITEDNIWCVEHSDGRRIYTVLVSITETLKVLQLATDPVEDAATENEVLYATRYSSDPDIFMAALFESAADASEFEFGDEARAFALAEYLHAATDECVL